MINPPAPDVNDLGSDGKLGGSWEIATGDASDSFKNKKNNFFDKKSGIKSFNSAYIVALIWLFQLYLVAMCQ